MPKAFLLAAGLGTRMRPLTNEIPKCLLPIGGKPLLQIWLDLLGKHRVNEVVINTHWHYEKVEEFINSEQNAVDSRKEYRGIKRKWPEVRLFFEPDLLGSGGTLLANKDWVGDGQPFYILYSDNLTNVDLTKLYAFHRNHTMPCTLGVFSVASPSQCGIADVNEEGVVTDFVEKPIMPKSDLAAAGIYVADNQIFDYFPQGQESLSSLDLGFHVLPKLVGRMMAYPIEEFLMDIGTIDSYEKAQALWKELKP
jgi:mannose-1-phosphate guanylyltransferase